MFSKRLLFGLVPLCSHAYRRMSGGRLQALILKKKIAPKWRIGKEDILCKIDNNPVSDKCDLRVAWESWPKVALASHEGGRSRWPLPWPVPLGEGWHVFCPEARWWEKQERQLLGFKFSPIPIDSTYRWSLFRKGAALWGAVGEACQAREVTLKVKWPGPPWGPDSGVALL